MQKVEQIEQLKKYYSDIAPIEKECWELIEDNISELVLNKEEVYANAGDYVKRIGFLSTGIMRVFYLDQNGNEWNKVFLEPNSTILGNIDFNGQAHYSIAAVTDCSIFYYSIEILEKALEKYRSIRTIQSELLADLIKRKSERETDFLSLTAKQRYIKLKTQKPHLLEIVPQYHIASYLGITPTQLSRIKLSV